MTSAIDYNSWLTEIKKSNVRYQSLFENVKPYPPIFFFGDPGGAIASTIGVNPSAGEFSPNRMWEGYNQIDKLLDRCRNYFRQPSGIPSHPWFETWEKFLDKIGLSYRASPRAVHLDLSPRATRSMGALQAGGGDLSALFLDLIRNDLGHFFAQLRLYPEIKFLYAAGSVTKKFYMIEFLQRYSYRYECSFRPVMPFVRGGQGQIGLYQLDLKDGNPRQFFFCSTSPSSRTANPNPLIEKGVCIKAKCPEFFPHE